MGRKQVMFRVNESLGKYVKIRAQMNSRRGGLELEHLILRYINSDQKELAKYQAVCRSIDRQSSQGDEEK